MALTQEWFETEGPFKKYNFGTVCYRKSKQQGRIIPVSVIDNNSRQYKVVMESLYSEMNFENNSREGFQQLTKIIVNGFLTLCGYKRLYADGIYFLTIRSDVRAKRKANYITRKDYTLHDVLQDPVSQEMMIFSFAKKIAILMLIEKKAGNISDQFFTVDNKTFKSNIELFLLKFIELFTEIPMLLNNFYNQFLKFFNRGDFEEYGQDSFFARCLTYDITLTLFILIMKMMFDTHGYVFPSDIFEYLKSIYNSLESKKYHEDTETVFELKNNLAKILFSDEDHENSYREKWFD